MHILPCMSLSILYFKQLQCNFDKEARLLQAVRTLMKCCTWRPFIWFFTFCESGILLVFEKQNKKLSTAKLFQKGISDDDLDNATPSDKIFTLHVWNSLNLEMFCFLSLWAVQTLIKMLLYVALLFGFSRFSQVSKMWGKNQRLIIFSKEAIESKKKKKKIPYYTKRQQISGVDVQI